MFSLAIRLIHSHFLALCVSTTFSITSFQLVEVKNMLPFGRSGKLSVTICYDGGFRLLQFRLRLLHRSSTERPPLPESGVRCQSRWKQTAPGAVIVRAKAAKYVILKTTNRHLIAFDVVGTVLRWRFYGCQSPFRCRRRVNDVTIELIIELCRSGQT